MFSLKCCNIIIVLLWHCGEQVYINNFPETPQNPARKRAGISLCYIRKLFLKSNACTPTHTHSRGLHARTRAHTNTNGCTITCPTSSVTSKAHSPPWYLILCTVCVRTHAAITNTPLHRDTRGLSFHQNILGVWILPGNWKRRNFICSDWTCSMATTCSLAASYRCVAHWPNDRYHTLADPV